MDVLGDLVAAGLEHGDVLGHGAQPLLAPDHVGGPHEVVVADVGEVIGGDAVGLQQHLVDDVLGHLDPAPDQVLEDDALVLAALGAEAQDPALPGSQIGLDLLQTQVPALGVFAEVAPDGGPVRLLLLPKLRQLLGAAEAGIGLALLHQPLGHGVVDENPLALGVGAVVPLLGAEAGDALGELHPEGFKALDDGGNAVVDLPLLVGVLDAQIADALGGLGHQHVRQGPKEAADVEIARGGGSKAGHTSALGQLPGRVFHFQILRRQSHVGEEQIGELDVVHGCFS